MPRKRIEKELAILRRFIEVYCRHHHKPAEGETLCPDCQVLLAYAQASRAKCHLNPKPKCKNCTTPCFKPVYRAQIRKVMRFSGMYFVKRGRIDWLIRYFLS